MAAHVVVLCTGNAARSVMVGAMLDAHAVPARVTTAGTHALERQPVSRRTRDALAAFGLDASAHRSRQLTDADVAEADVVIALAGEHVAYVRRRHPEAATRTATLRWLVDHLPGGPTPLAHRVAVLGLERVDPAQQGDVADPAGGDDAQYAACALEVSVLVAKIAGRLN